MRVLDPGHSYELASLDGGEPIKLEFVKREGEMYPGNVGHHPGTTLQEVWRATIDRLKYLNGQIPDESDDIAIHYLEMAILCLENRAAIRHGRPIHFSADVAAYGIQCPKCLHVGCSGLCH